MSNRAQSSVIGSVLLVALVVLVSATAGVAVLDGADTNREPAPAAAFTVDTCSSCPSIADPGLSSTTNYVNVTYTDGEPLRASRLSVTIDETVVFDPAKTGRAAYSEPANYDGAGTNDLRWSSDTVSAGERLVLEDDADADDDVFASGQTLRIVWSSPTSDDSYVLKEVTLTY